jgi:hypothetical protein
MKVRVTKVPATAKCFLQVIDSTSRLDRMNPHKTDVTPKIGTNWDMVRRCHPPSLTSAEPSVPPQRACPSAIPAQFLSIPRFRVPCRKEVPEGHAPDGSSRHAFQNRAGPWGRVLLLYPVSNPERQSTGIEHRSRCCCHQGNPRCTGFAIGAGLL